MDVIKGNIVDYKLAALPIAIYRSVLIKANEATLVEGQTTSDQISFRELDN